jgi:hypothetical protein
MLPQCAVLDVSGQLLVAERAQTQRAIDTGDVNDDPWFFHLHLTGKNG